MRSKPSLLVAVTVLLCGCEKEVKLNLATGAPKLVVEGGIENGAPPVVVLTKSIGFFSKFDLNALSDAFVHDAVVTVSDGMQTAVLREYALDTGSTGAKFYLYSLDTAGVGTLLLGVPEKTYRLSVQTGGTTYTAVTKIPAFRPLDSFWFAPPVVTPDKVPAARQLFIRYTDPDTPGNANRFYTRRNSEPFYPGVSSVFNDEIINNSTISVSIPAGYNRGKSPSFDSLGYVFVGDTVTLRWSAIDRAAFDFWSTLEFSTGSVGSPFATPIQVATNISGGALGIWAGYGSQYRTIVIDK